MTVATPLVQLRCNGMQTGTRRHNGTTLPSYSEALMALRPQDLPELRADLLNWTVENGDEFFERCIQGGAQANFIAAPPKAAGTWLCATERSRLASAELYWVAEEMTELCVEAAKRMPAWELAPEDLPSLTGLMYFEGLAELRPDFPATALVWGQCPSEAAGTLKGGAGIWLSAYTDLATMPELSAEQRHLQAQFGRLMYSGESIAAYGQREEGDVSFTSEDGELMAAEDDQPLVERVGSLALIKAAWLLMQQELAATSETTADRAALKRLRRAGRPNDSGKTRVIALRHRASGEQSSVTKDFRHQWIVRGHWRQQWYPSRQVHRPVWIAPHIKGPDGAPLLGGEKVYAWKR